MTTAPLNTTNGRPRRPLATSTAITHATAVASQKLRRYDSSKAAPATGAAASAHRGIGTRAAMAATIATTKAIIAALASGS